MSENKLDKAIPASTARQIYNFIGKRYDLFSSFDARAKERALRLLNAQTADHILEVGVGTGMLHSRIASAVQSAGIAFGIDISPVMVKISRQRSQSPTYQADARNTPFVSDYFNHIYMSYVLDLLPVTEIPVVLAGLLRILKTGGSIVIVALTEGVNIPSRTLVAAWKATYAVSPILCAGCRPLQLIHLVKSAGFSDVQREVIVQLAVPSEIVMAKKPQ